jgi:hypothetical protein
MQFWTDLAREPTFDLLSTCDIEDGYPLPDGLDTIGLQSREAYEELVGSVKVMLGMGAPMISPSVYSSLCVGAGLGPPPVILPGQHIEFRRHGEALRGVRRPDGSAT